MRPGEQVLRHKAVEFCGHGLGKLGHETQQKADVVLGSARAFRRYEPMLAHPAPELQGRLAEHDALAIGVDRAPRRRSLVGGPHEEAAVLMGEVLGCVGGALRHEGKRALGSLCVDEGPLGCGGRGVERCHGGKGGTGAACERVLQEEGREHVADEGDLLELGLLLVCADGAGLGGQPVGVDGVFADVGLRRRRVGADGVRVCVGLGRQFLGACLILAGIGHAASFRRRGRKMGCVCVRRATAPAPQRTLSGSNDCTRSPSSCLE